MFSAMGGNLGGFDGREIIPMMERPSEVLMTEIRIKPHQRWASEQRLVLAG